MEGSRCGKTKGETHKHRSPTAGTKWPPHKAQEPGAQRLCTTEKRAARSWVDATRDTLQASYINKLSRTPLGDLRTRGWRDFSV